VEKKDPFDEIDFGSYFQDYLDPGFRTAATSFEEIDRPTFDNFLSQPSTLTDHLDWQLGSMSLTAEVRLAADLVVGNLNEDGYLTATDEELVDAFLETRGPAHAEPIPFERGMKAHRMGVDAGSGAACGGAPASSGETVAVTERTAAMATVLEGREVVNHLDPLGVGARDLRECLLIQLAAHRREAEMVLKRAQTQTIRLLPENGDGLGEELAGAVLAGGVQAGEGIPAGNGYATNGAAPGMVERNGHGRLGPARNGCGGDIFEIAGHIVANHLALLQKKDMRELTRSCGRTAEEVQAAVDFIRTLDPRPGQRYNVSETRLIEPDVAFVKRDGEYVVLMNEEDMPTLRLSHSYRRMLREKGTEKEVREYVKERYKSAIQLLRNIEQRKNTIVRTCEAIVRRQQEFLERGEQGLKPMMIKEVAEEIGVHPSTVSRAVANKYVHTSQGVYELRYFFTEGVNGPEGADLPLVLLKRKVKKLIEDEDSSKPLTDDQLAAELQRQGIRVTRRTVAKYREDMQIPSTHQRRVR
jgi:RNA polymerase sigma-54 factor